MDPVLTALGIVAEGLAAELAQHVARHRFRGRGDQITTARAARMMKGSADRLAGALRHELAGVPEHEWHAAVAAVRDSVAAVTPLGLDEALDLELRPERLETYIRSRTGAIRRAAAFSAAGESAYDRVLAATCREIVKMVVNLPGFTAALQVAAFQEMRDLRRTVEQLAGPPEDPAGPDPDHAAFERRYLDHVVGTLGRLELFGVSRGRTPRTHSFDQAYVSLAVARSGHRLPGDDDDELTGAGVDVTNALHDHRRILLRGGAGAGKTTLLRWLAVSAARASSDDRTAGRRPVPFFIPLRQFAHRDLPPPEGLPEAVTRVIAAEMPSTWAAQLFRDGRALLLVDGVDELEPERRRGAREWLEQIVTAYDDVRVVVSARPFAIGEDWLAASGFVTYDLLPLSAKGIDDFLVAWHDAAREEHTDDPSASEWLDQCQRGLAEQLAARLELRRLAGSPLLCGLLCALHRERNMHLPRDRKGLYDAALDLLLVRWDETRGVRVDEWPALSKEEQIVLLQRFAYSLVKNHELVVSREDAAQRLGHAMRGLRTQDVGAEPVLQRTLERTGLLREPNPDQVQFIHRTFRDHLAAKEAVDAGDLAFLVEQAHLDHWHDVVVNAVALARPRERDWLLRRLVDGNTASRADPRVHDRLHLVAAACLEHADVLDTDEVRAMVQRAAARLIPPATLDEAELLARAGPFVVDLLPGPAGLSSTQAACVVRTAAIIGGEGVLDKLAQFVPVVDGSGPDPGGAGRRAGESRIIDELLRAWRRSDDPDGYARTVLAEVDFGDRTLEVRGWHRVRCLPHLTRLTSVVCYGDFMLLDAVAAVPRLRRLELVQNEMVRDLQPLARCRTLRTLVLSSGCQFLQDLSPLAATTVEELHLNLVAADLRTLRSDRLRCLVVRDPRLAGGLEPLPADLDLRELVVGNLPNSRNLLGVERWQQLEQVSVRGVPRDGEVAALAELPRLARLTVDDAGDGRALADLRSALPDVDVVDSAVDRQPPAR